MNAAAYAYVGPTDVGEIMRVAVSGAHPTGKTTLIGEETPIKARRLGRRL